MTDYVFSDLLSLTKDGEWGQGEDGPDLEPMHVVRGTDFAQVRLGNINGLPIRYIPKRIADRKALQEGDIVFETAGGTKDQPTGRSVLLSKQVFKSASHRIICASFSRFLRVKPDVVDPDYLYWHLQAAYKSGVLLPYHIQHTGVARFQYTDFSKSHHVELPSLSEQRRISGVLSEFDEKIALNGRMNEILEAMARAIFKDWFIDFGPTRAKMEGAAAYLAPEIWSSFPDGLNSDGTPEGWSLGSLADYADLNPESWTRSEYPQSITYVDLSNTKWGFIEATVQYVKEEAPSRAQRRLRPGDTIVGTVRPGNGSYAYVDREGLTGSTGFAVLRPKSSEFREFVYLAATLSGNIQRLAHLADGGAYPAVSYDSVLATASIVAPLSVLRHFSRLNSDLFSSRSANLEEVSSLSNMRDLLLPKLMSGEIRLKEAEKAVESVV
jgi:type I restriction enzyme S subunit